MQEPEGTRWADQRKEASSPSRQMIRFTRPDADFLPEHKPRRPQHISSMTVYAGSELICIGTMVCNSE
ncbi:hypothetical protein MUK42_15053 [Musa troglodytarum]|uniref:Uncharacterized protein n=1 Tax=Musa troglodytarum TaxID=320322 RepID=A0A9E7KVK8_9LILI|nr:hypothetical protein MUK42_15053 [Musa troglodytarum]